jgi:hypothetical protein
MTLERTLHPSGIYIDRYVRTRGELKALERRAANRPAPEPITPYEPPRTVAFLIRQGIRQTKARQEDVAGIVGVTRRTFRSWLDNRIVPSEAHLDALAEVLQLDRETLRQAAGRQPLIGRIAPAAWNGGLHPNAKETV